MTRRIQQKHFIAIRTLHTVYRSGNILLNHSLLTSQNVTNFKCIYEAFCLLCRKGWSCNFDLLQHLGLKRIYIALKRWITDERKLLIIVSRLAGRLTIHTMVFSNLRLTRRLAWVWMIRWLEHWSTVAAINLKSHVRYLAQAKPSSHWWPRRD